MKQYVFRKSETVKCNSQRFAVCFYRFVYIMKAAENSKAIAANGIEISTEYNGTELHILGLFLPEEKFKK